MENKPHTDTVTKVLEKVIKNGFDFTVRGKFLRFTVREDDWGLCIIVEYENKEYNMILHKRLSLPDITSRVDFWKALCGEEWPAGNKGMITGSHVVKKITQGAPWQHHIQKYHLLETEEEKIEYLEGFL